MFKKVHMKTMKYSLIIEKNFLKMIDSFRLSLLLSEHKTMNFYILGRGSFCGQRLLFVQGVHLVGVSDPGLFVASCV